MNLIKANLIEANGTEVNAKILYPTKTMRELKGRVFRTELKVWILIFAPVVSWR